MSSRAFTLIELLVVIAILGVLASIVLVSFRESREDAREAVAEQFSSQLDRLLGAELVGKWDFTGNPNDSSGYKNHGTVNGATPAADRAGVGNRAYSFNGTSDYIQIGKRVLVGPPLSLSVWVRLDELDSSFRYILANGGEAGAAKDGFFIYKNSTNSFVFRGKDSGTNQEATASTNAVAGTWTHLAGTWNGTGSAKLYLNGILVGEGAPGPYTPGTQEPNLRIGSGSTGLGSYWKGKIDDIRVFNQALTAREIQQYYAETAPRYQVAVDHNP